MQNKPNSLNVQIYINIYDTKDYKNFIPLAEQKNKPNSNPIKPKTNPILSAVGGLQMNVNIYYTKVYKNETAFRRVKTNPKQSQNKPNFRKKNVTFCFTGYYESKQKALKKPPLLEVNSKPLIKDW